MDLPLSLHNRYFKPRFLVSRIIGISGMVRALHDDCMSHCGLLMVKKALGWDNEFESDISDKEYPSRKEGELGPRLFQRTQFQLMSRFS